MRPPIHQGVTHHNAKLTPETVRAIRARHVWQSASDGCVAIARDYGLAKETVRQVLVGRTWGHVQ